MPRECEMINCTEKGNVLACSCMNGPRLPEASPGKESGAGARVNSNMAY